ncbi:MAG: 4'-phosphopantetheinyl transferase superfamily protein [Pseudomonadota bacterium]
MKNKIEFCPDKIHWSIAISTNFFECCLVYCETSSALMYQNFWSTPDECLALQCKPQSLAARICARFAQAQFEPQSHKTNLLKIDSLNKVPYFVGHLNVLSLSHEKEVVAALVVKPLNNQQKILSAGVDCANIQRFINPIFQNKLIDRIATDQEKKWLHRHPENLPYFWAAKEAVSKVLKTGIGLVSWKEIEINCSSTYLKKCNVTLHGQAQKISEILKINTIILQNFSYQNYVIITAIGLEN